MKRQLSWKHMAVPWITPWSGEPTGTPDLEVRYGAGGAGIGYVGEDPYVDRRHDALWVRRAATPGYGRPALPDMHPLRQRQAMAHMLCQVCGRSVLGRPDGRFLVVMNSRLGPISDGEVTAVPPLHTGCAQRAIAQCPHLRGRWTAALVSAMPLWGVAGVIIDPHTLAPLPGPDEDGGGLHQVPYTDTAGLRWVIAARLLVSLEGVELVDVKRLTREPVAALG
ncbi:hypothetical protein JHN59_13830 [Streptomyces sp. MBT49]|uniref:hypothetical protein n=1 Tax=Streptomyces sp. MBT49 TaxID=1488380 RepID=UPI00190C65C8|nr:hypothetical protein [Streptomyces sp. MBT49]MBK3625903.1 hypothetical protein [Streptomyces sp. MBT49]